MKKAWGILALTATIACSPLQPANTSDSAPAKHRARILLTNDDGIDAPGITALRRVLEAHPERYDLTVVAPASNRSGSGMAKTNNDVLLEQRGRRAYAVMGTPADCVIAALGGLLTERPDLVVSGMNFGANLGRVALMSGTVGAAMTAASAGLPALAISVGAVARPDRTLETFPDAARLSEALIRAVVEHPGSLAEGRVLSVNYPALPVGEVRGVMATRQAAQFPKNRTYALVRRAGLHASHKRFTLVRTGAVRPSDLGQEGDDVRAFAEGWVTITPMDGDWTAAPDMQNVSDLIRALPSPVLRQ